MSFDLKRVIKYGLAGSADITGILKNGKRVEIECKTGKGKLHLRQKAFQKMILDHEGIYIVARSVDQVISDIEKKRQPSFNA